MTSLEIRKLSPKHRVLLCQILDEENGWQKLMEIIPACLQNNDSENSISNKNIPKYNTEQVNLIQAESVLQKRSPTDILFDEWGTSGKVRPTTGQLLHLLIEANLFKAADYIAVEILKSSPPLRPDSGPARKIVLNDNEILHYTNNKTLHFNQNLDYTKDDLNQIKYKHSNAVLNVDERYNIKVADEPIGNRNSAEVPNYDYQENHNLTSSLNIPLLSSLNIDESPN